MLSEFLTEIIAASAILIILVIYIIIKKKSSSKTEEYTQDTQEFKIESDTTIKDPYDDHKEEIVLKKEPLTKEENIQDLGGTEEGDFGESAQKEAQEKEIAETQANKRSIRKRDVIKHGKIKKDSFKEFAGERILVAEDNLINQKVLTGLLADSGIDIVIANDGQEALDILEKDDDFLLILMDAHMPRVDGFEATRQIRANPKYSHILVVALSGDTAADDIKKMTEAGMQEQLEKPLRMETLYDVIYAYSGNKEAKKDLEFVEVVMTKELNGDKGLSICGGDEEFYHEILAEFVTTYGDSAHRLQELLENENISQADKLLLDIIGVSANIGADTLNNIAENIKDALKDKQEKNYLSLVIQYKIHLEALLNDIKEYLNS